MLFEGNAQALDRILATGNPTANAQIDAVHTNTPLGNPGPDHDPLLALFTVGGLPVIDGTSGEDDIDGSDSSEEINAGNRDDTVDGNGGDDGIDILNGGAGLDMLTGGLRRDTFVLDASGSAMDTDIVTDFDPVTDDIEINGASGKAILFTQVGLDTDVTADGVLIATLQNADAQSALDQTTFDVAPASAGVAAPPVTTSLMDPGVMSMTSALSSALPIDQINGDDAPQPIAIDPLDGFESEDMMLAWNDSAMLGFEPLA